MHGYLEYLLPIAVALGVPHLMQVMNGESGARRALFYQLCDGVVVLIHNNPKGRIEDSRRGILERLDDIEYAKICEEHRIRNAGSAVDYKVLMAQRLLQSRRNQIVW